MELAALAIRRDAQCERIRVQGLEYHWTPACSLNREQAAYALRRLWDIAAGPLCHASQPLIRFAPASKGCVQKFLAAPKSFVQWVAVGELLGEQSPLAIRGQRLPAAPIEQPIGRIATDKCIDFPFDLPTLAFLMLSRWEEASAALDRDEHDRPDESSFVANRCSFAHLPVVDLWCMVLRTLLQRRGASVQPRTPNLFLTHDVDRPVRYWKLSRVARGAVGALSRRGASPRSAAAELHAGWRCYRGKQVDPYLDALKKWATVSEQLETRSSFFIMTSDRGRFDEGYSPACRPFREVLASLAGRGHELGWHPGYQAARNRDVFEEERRRITQLFGAAVRGGRYHYLRWIPGCWEQWEDARISYDSSLGYARSCGFRCGTCHPYPVFSLPRNCELNLVERPLLMMDVALARVHQSGGDAAALSRNIIDKVLAVGGEATVLVHNCFSHPDVLPPMLAQLSRFGSRGVDGEQLAALTSSRP